MDKYVILVCLLAPGFIARSIAGILGNFPDKKTEFESVMSYFSYSFFSMLISFYIAYIVGMYEYGDSVKGVIEKFSEMGAIFKFFLIALFSSVLVGIGWTLIIRKGILWLFNKCINNKDGSETFLDNTLAERLFCDGKKHFVVVKKDGAEIAVGYFNGISSVLSSKAEISVINYTEFEAWLEYAKNSQEDHELKHKKVLYYNLDDNIIIQEYEFPDDWLKKEEKRNYPLSWKIRRFKIKLEFFLFRCLL